MQDTKPNWPIRVGGLYRAVDQNHSPARVTAIVGDQVHHEYAHGERTYTTAPCSTHTFCKLWTPEDQSPLPDLVFALKSIMKQGLTHANIDLGLAALALAGESEEESEDANAQL